MAGNSGAAPRGRIDKRRAILRAAFTVFAREGFAQACVKEIAAEAGVAKPTVYNHLDSKDNLFRHALEVAAEEITDANLAAIERLTVDSVDLRADLEDVGLRLLRRYVDERSVALRRLLYAELAHFPDLLETSIVRCAPRLQSALADRLARLSLAGRLRACDPDLAAGQLLGLLTGPLETRAQFGTHRVDDDELEKLARAGTDTFLRAYGSDSGIVAAIR